VLRGRDRRDHRDCAWSAVGSRQSKRFRGSGLYEAGVALRQLYTEHRRTGKLKCFGKLFVPELAMKGVVIWLVIWIYYYFVLFWRRPSFVIATLCNGPTFVILLVVIIHDCIIAKVSFIYDM
jgi:hypothetical protein